MVTYQLVMQIIFCTAVLCDLIMRKTQIGLQRIAYFTNVSEGSLIFFNDLISWIPLRPHPPAVTSAPQSSSRYSTAADALAALVDAAASAPQMDVAKVKESKHERDEDMSSSATVRRAPSLSEQQQPDAESRSLHSPYSAMSLPGGKPHPAYPEGPGSKDKAPQTKSRIEEELRTHGKTTITAASFIDVIITRQIASDKDSRERAGQSSDSSGRCEFFFFFNWQTIQTRICCDTTTALAVQIQMLINFF